MPRAGYAPLRIGQRERCCRSDRPASGTSAIFIPLRSAGTGRFHTGIVRQSGRKILPPDGASGSCIVVEGRFVREAPDLMVGYYGGMFELWRGIGPLPEQRRTIGRPHPSHFRHDGYPPPAGRCAHLAKIGRSAFGLHAIVSLLKIFTSRGVKSC